MGKLFELLGWLRKLGLDPANLQHMWSDVMAIYGATNMDDRIRAIIHFATHLTDLIPGTIDDEVVGSLARLTGADEDAAVAAVLAAIENPAVGAAPGGVDGAAYCVATELRACGLAEV